MFRVMVVDDEPAAVLHICQVIQRKCFGFFVCATAENGRDCLEKIREQDIDLVITDVKMPIMNGIETVSALRQEFPDVLSIIVSGYQEFEYAQGAIKAGAYDYILKPVVPEDMRKTLEKAAVLLQRKYYYHKNNLIHSMCNAEKCDLLSVRKYFPEKAYHIGLIRRNGLPRRFSVSGNLEIFSDIQEQATIYGRDEMEALCLVSDEMLKEQNFEHYLERIGSRNAQQNEYLTIVYFQEAVSADLLQNVILQLYQKLDMISVIGFSQKIGLTISQEITRKEDFSAREINVMLSQIEYLLKEQQYDNVMKELKRNFLKWKEERRTQLWLEYVSRQIIYLFLASNKIQSSIADCEYMMEDAFYYSVSQEELLETLFEIPMKQLKGSEEPQKVDSPEFFALIKDYLGSHLTEVITLQSVCKHFGVSQTSLSKLFRKYKNQSFNRYVTEIRIQRAIEIMKADPDIYIRDVAAMTGYSDQFYFSRIFRSYTGKSPSEYLET